MELEVFAPDESAAGKPATKAESLRFLLGLMGDHPQLSMHIRNILFFDIQDLIDDINKPRYELDAAQAHAEREHLIGRVSALEGLDLYFDLNKLDLLTKDDRSND